MGCQKKMKKLPAKTALEESRLQRLHLWELLKKKKKKLNRFDDFLKKTEAFASYFSCIFVGQYSLPGVCLMFQTRGA